MSEESTETLLEKPFAGLASRRVPVQEDWCRKWILVNYLVLLGLGGVVWWWSMTVPMRPIPQAKIADMRVSVAELKVADECTGPTELLQQCSGSEAEFSVPNVARVRAMLATEAVQFESFEYGIVVEAGEQEAVSFLRDRKVLVSLLQPEPIEKVARRVLSRLDESRRSHERRHSLLLTTDLRLVFTKAGTGLESDFAAVVQEGFGGIVGWLDQFLKVKVIAQQRLLTGSDEALRKTLSSAVSFVQRATTVVHFVWIEEPTSVSGALYPEWGTVVRGGSEAEAVSVFADALRQLLEMDSWTGFERDWMEWTLSLDALDSTALILDEKLAKLLEISKASTAMNLQVPDEVVKLVVESMARFGEAMASAKQRTERALEALERARQAAFSPHLHGEYFHFPTEHRIAVYVPVFMPLVLPVVVGLLRLVKDDRAR